MLNWIDILLVLVVLVSAFFGWQRGFILGLLALVRWLGGLLAAFYLYQPVAQLIEQASGYTRVWSQPFAFLLLVILAGIVIQLLGNALLRRLPRDVHQRRTNRLLGVVPGAVNGLITAAIVAALLLAVPLTDEISEQARESELANRLAGYTETVETALVPIFDPAIRQTLLRRTPKTPESTERVELPFRVENVRPRPELEAQMLELINRERAAVGLGALAADPELVEVARRHSADMFARGYFAHVTPENRTPFDRIREANVRYLTAGENLALAPTLDIAHTGLMNSPGHRANILAPQYGRVGIGIMSGGMRGLMVTQNFRN